MLMWFGPVGASKSENMNGQKLRRKQRRKGSNNDWWMQLGVVGVTDEQPAYEYHKV